MSIHWIFQFTFLKNSKTKRKLYIRRVRRQSLTHARHARHTPSTQTSPIPILNPNVLRLSAAVHQQRVDKTLELKTIIIFFPFYEQTSLFLSLHIREQSKHTHTSLINSRDKDHPIMNRRIERITYKIIYIKEIPCWCCWRGPFAVRAQCRPLCKRWWIEWSVNVCCIGWVPLIGCQLHRLQ